MRGNLVGINLLFDCFAERCDDGLAILNVISFDGLIRIDSEAHMN
jgi:hypothetical protein